MSNGGARAELARGHVDKVTWGHGVVSPLCGVALFQVGIALRAILEAARLARSANPTRHEVKRGSGDREVSRRAEPAAQPRPSTRYPIT